MAQVVASGERAVAALNKPDRASRVLTEVAVGRPLVVSVPNFGRRHRCRSIIVSRVTDATSTTRTANGSAKSEAADVRQEAIAKPKVVVPPSHTGFMSVGAVITIVRKQRLSRDEQMTNAIDVFSDFTGSKVFLQLVSVEADAG